MGRADVTQTKTINIRSLVAWIRSRTVSPSKARVCDERGDDGCYSLSDGTLVPLGDLGVMPIEDTLKR